MINSRDKKNRHMKTKLIRFTAFILLMAIIGLFLHSELVGHFSDEQLPGQHDFCHIVVTTIVPQQNVFHKFDFAFTLAIFLLIHIASEEPNADPQSLIISHPVLYWAPRTILFQSFLI